MLTALSAVGNTRAFVPTTCPPRSSCIRPNTFLQSFDGGSFGGNGEGGGMEEIEFRIYPDGRLEKYYIAYLFSPFVMSICKPYLFS